MNRHSDLIAEARKLPEAFRKAQLPESAYLEDDAIAELDATGYNAVYIAQKLADALEEAHEVLAGADHTAAKYWRLIREAEVAAGVAEDRVKHAQEEAFKAGWMSSGEGFNGEYPDEGRPWELSVGREAYERWVEKGLD